MLFRVYRANIRELTATMFVYSNKEMMAVDVHNITPCGIELNLVLSSFYFSILIACFYSYASFIILLLHELLVKLKEFQIQAENT